VQKKFLFASSSVYDEGRSRTRRKQFPQSPVHQTAACSILHRRRVLQWLSHFDLGLHDAATAGSQHCVPPPFPPLSADREVFQWTNNSRLNHLYFRGSGMAQKYLLRKKKKKKNRVSDFE
jgi:hypothetical protein